MHGPFISEEDCYRAGLETPQSALFGTQPSFHG
jgi:hypothetical protein